MTPKLLKLSMIAALLGSETVLSRTNANVGCPALALASTIYFPMYPVAPMTRILLFTAISNSRIVNYSCKLDGHCKLNRCRNVLGA